MAKNTRDKDSRTAQLAEPFRDLLKSLIRERVKTEADKRELADYLNRSVSFVNQLIYYGEGGLDAWLGALTFAYQLDATKLATVFKNYKFNLRKISPLCEADKLWFEFDREMTDDTKFYWVSLIRATLELEKTFRIQRVCPKQKISSGHISPHVRKARQEK